MISLAILLKYHVTYEELEEPEHSYNTKNVRDGSHEGPKPREGGIHHGAEEQRYEEQHKEHCGVPDNGSEGDDSDADQWAWRQFSGSVGERLHEHVRDDEQYGHHSREDNLGEEYIPPLGARNIA